MDSPERLLRHPGLRPLWVSLERDRRRQQIAAAGTLLGGLLAVYLTLGRGLFWPLVAAVVATAGLAWLVSLRGGERRIDAWRQRLRDRPESIVWVYSLLTARMPFGLEVQQSATLYLVGPGGELHDFGLQPSELKLVTKTLNRLLPHAEFGYTEERELRHCGRITPYRGTNPYR